MVGLGGHEERYWVPITAAFNGKEGVVRVGEVLSTEVEPSEVIRIDVLGLHAKSYPYLANNMSAGKILGIDPHVYFSANSRTELFPRVWFSPPL